MARTSRERRPSPERRAGRPDQGRHQAPARQERPQARPSAARGARRGSVAASAAHRAERAQARQKRSRRGIGGLLAKGTGTAAHVLTGPGTRRPRALFSRRTALGRRNAGARTLLWAGVAVAVTAVALVASFVTGKTEAARLAPARAVVAQAEAAGPHGAFEILDATAQANGELASAVAAIESQGDTVGWYLCATDGTVLSSRNADTAYYAASAIKGPYALSVLSDEDSGAPGRLKDSMTNAIVDSDNDSYYRIKSAFGTERINEWLGATGSTERLDEDYGSYVDLTPKQLAGLWAQAYPYIQSQEQTEGSYAMEIFAEPSNSVIPELEGVTDSWSKPGWIAVDSASSTVNAGVVERGGEAYVIAVMTDAGDDFEKFDQVVAALDSVGQLALTVAA